MARAIKDWNCPNKKQKVQSHQTQWPKSKDYKNLSICDFNLTYLYNCIMRIVVMNEFAKSHQQTQWLGREARL